MLFCPIRSKWVAATPEEAVRQALIQKMIGELGYPLGLIAVEKDLASLPHQQIRAGLDPNRRLDLLCYRRAKEGAVPLLLVECKATALLGSAQQQLLGYNQIVGAPFLCLVNQREVRTFWQVKEKMDSVPFLPSYSQLLEKI